MALRPVTDSSTTVDRRWTDDPDPVGYRDDFDDRPLRAEPPAPKAHPFKCELDLTELDDRGRVGLTWSGRGIELSRSTLLFRSRRMCYEGRRILVAVHLVDDTPVPLLGDVRQCEYAGDGLYRTRIELTPIPDDDGLRAWVKGIEARGSF